MSIGMWVLLIILLGVGTLAIGFKLGFYAGAYDVLSRGEPLDTAINKHGNPFVKQEWKLFIRTVAPGNIDSGFFSHVKRLCTFKKE